VNGVMNLKSVICQIIPTATIMVLLLSSQMMAQDFSGAFEGMQDSDEPIQITSNKLEVKDKQGTAVFTGNVEVVQGATILNAKRMKVSYSRGGKTPNGNLRSIEATGKITVRSGDQKVSADRGDFNMLKQTVKLTGNVLITQGTNVVSGCVLEVNLKTSSAVLKPCKNGIKGRPQMLFSTKNAGKKN
jgi:lipopolysaccharide export system protein LptA